MQNIFRAKYFYMHQNASCVNSQRRQSLTETACINMSRVSMQCPICKASISSTKKLNLGRFRYACDGQHSTAPLRSMQASDFKAPGGWLAFIVTNSQQSSHGGDVNNLRVTCSLEAELGW